MEQMGQMEQFAPIQESEGRYMEINNTGNVFEQIVNYYRKYISLGLLEEIDRMPSCRELAIKIGVNHKTVDKAYQELVKEGLIYNVPKKGFFVRGKVVQKENKMAKEVILNLKNQGVEKGELLSIIEKGDGGESDD